jgi:hypothetical protein
VNDSNKDSKTKINTQDDSLTSDFGRLVNPSNMFGPFSLFSSPLFILMTVSIIVISFLMTQYIENLEVIILSSLIVELITSVVIWQYLKVSQRLENIITQTVNLQSIIRKSEINLTKKVRQHLTELSAAHGNTQRLLGEMSVEQSEILQSNNEGIKAIDLIFDQIETFNNQAKNWQIKNQEHSIKVKKSLDTLKSETIDQFGLTRETFLDSDKKVKSEIHAKLEELSNKPKESLQKALQISTALDRFNLEVRRQLAEMRQKLDKS